MQTTPKLYTDIDYESFPIADLDLDLHWIQLPNSVLAARRHAKLLALEQAREKTLPKIRKYSLSPPTLSTPPPSKTCGPSSPTPSISASPSFPKRTAPSVSPSVNSATNTAAGATLSPPTS